MPPEMTAVAAAAEVDMDAAATVVGGATVVAVGVMEAEMRAAVATGAVSKGAAAAKVGVETAVATAAELADLAVGTEAVVRAASGGATGGAYSSDRRNFTPSSAISNRSTSRAKALWSLA